MRYSVFNESTRGGCCMCGGYCDLWFCSPRCREAYDVATARKRPGCKVCGSLDGYDFVTMLCAPCLEAEMGPEQLEYHRASHDADGRWNGGEEAESRRLDREAGITDSAGRLRR